MTHATSESPAGQSASQAAILVGFAEALAAIEVIWSLRAAGWEVVAFTRAGAKPAARRIPGLQLHPVCPPEIDARRTVEDVEALVRAWRPAAVMPLDDYALWVCSRAKLDGAANAGAKGDAAEAALDKQAQLHAASEAGLLIPPTEIVDDLESSTTSPFPVFVKPGRALYEYEGRLVRPTGTICADMSELASASTRPWNGPLLVQPLLTGSGEGLFGHASDVGVVAWSAHRRIRMVNPQGSASSCCASTPVDASLTTPAEQFLKLLGWRGLFMLEFLRDKEGRPWFMELNGRPWGSMALSRRRGFEYPAWSIKATLDPLWSPVAPSAPPDLRCRHLGMELAHLAFVLRGPRSEALTNWPRAWPTVADLLRISRQDRLYNWDRHQPTVLLADTWATLKFYLSRVVRSKQ